MVNGHRKLLPKGLEGPGGLLHFSEIPMSVVHSGRLENAPKHALPNGNVLVLPKGNAAVSPKLKAAETSGFRIVV